MTNSDENIRRFVSSIKVDFGNDAYVGVTSDRRFENTSPKLRELWYSDSTMSISTLDTFYNRIKSPEYPDYTAEVFMKDAMKLKTDLSQEFERLSRGA